MNTLQKLYKNGKISVSLIVNDLIIGEIRYCEDGYISKLSIKNKYRNNGYAKYLLQFVNDKLYNKCPSVRLYVGVENEIAINLYKSVGFFIVCIISDKSHYLMAKQLQNNSLSDLVFISSDSDHQNRTT